ncbi:MAG TPA: adenylate/guanylate cyclase domain-containing protein [Chthoniobacterales bacterium]|nr:adenylate/guanylate cyclase domain-containing protein [Chthoniobacterales bacterium]
MHWLARHRPFVVAAICALCAGVVFAGHFLPNVPFVSWAWQQEQGFEDFLQREGRKARTHPEFVFLGIDQSTLQLPPLSPEELASSRGLQLLSQRPPWSREIWALLLDRLIGAGARGVMFDLVSNPPNEGDAIFHEALDRYRDRVVIGANFDFSQGIQAVVPYPDLIPPPQLQDDRVGYVVFFTDPLDGKVRSVRYMTSDRILAGQNPHPSQEVFYALSARMLTKIGHAADVPSDFQAHQFRFAATDAYQPLPMYEVFDPKLWHANYGDGAFFKDKIIIVGASSQVAHDFVTTPMSPDTPGPQLHIYAMVAAIDHDFLYPTSERTDLILVAVAGILAWALIALVRRPLFSVLSIIGIAGAYLVFVRLAYDRAGLLVAVVPVLSAFLTAGLLSLLFEFVLERMEKVRTRRTLERYVSKNLVKEILDNPDSFYSSLRGVRLPATILFSDIVGFTGLTEKADPEKLVSQLNEYLSRMTAAVFANNGTLDKFIGDAVMAVWGNVTSAGVAEDAKACARAAITMRHELLQLNQQWKERGIAPFQFGIGINHGEVLVGNIGSQEKADPTVIGDAVNLASRLEALTRIYSVDILVGDRAAALIRDQFNLRSVALVQVKGKTEPVEVFTLVSAKETHTEFLQRLETYETGFRKFRERDFTQAKVLFSQFLEFYPDDTLARMYLERALEYEEQPPDAAWNAVEVFKKK